MQGKRGLGRQIAGARVGDSVTFVRPMELGDVRAASKAARYVGSYVPRLAPGTSWRYETFTAITSRGRLVVGCIMERTK
jgi:hypothetical protein